MPGGMITNVQHFSVHDGPGVRTTLFFKGCGLRCFWCHNPETLSFDRELSFDAGKCIGCGACSEVCPVGNPGEVRFTETCLLCGECAETCFFGAIGMFGEKRDAESLEAELLRDRAAFESSGGGVTFSGGEPLLQPEFLKALLEICRKNGIHTAVETGCFCRKDVLLEIAPLVDLFMCDVKAFDCDLHIRGTGQPNGIILENIRSLDALGAEMILRTPVIPGFNDSEEQIGKIAEFAAGCRRRHALELLPFHGLCEGKYRSLGKNFGGAGLETPDGEKMKTLCLAVKKHGVECIINKF